MTDHSAEQVDRRNFLKTTAAVAAGGVMMASQEAEAALPTRVLGRTGLKVTTVTFGAMFLSDMSQQRVLDAAIDLGMNLVHVSPAYTGGRAIEVVGAVMKRKRSKVYIALKVDPTDTNMGTYLRKLNTDHVDILVPPKGNTADFANARVKQAFATLKQQGKIRFSGYAGHDNMASCLKAAMGAGFWDVCLLRYNIGCRGELDPVVAQAAGRSKMGILVMKGIEGLNRKSGTALQAGLRNLLNNRYLSSLCLGMKSVEEVRTNAGAVQTADAAADRAFDRYVASCAGALCSTCGRCTEACPAGVAVNEYLRAWNYLDRGDDFLARDLVAGLAPRHTLAACTSCGRCNQACQKQINVLSRLHEAAHA